MKKTSCLIMFLLLFFIWQCDDNNPAANHDTNDNDLPIPIDSTGMQISEDLSFLSAVLIDSTNDLELASSDNPPAVIPYPSVDVESIYIGIQNNYLYMKVVYADTIPQAKPLVQNNTVELQDITINFDTDNNFQTGAFQHGLGVDIYFVMLVRYGLSINAYANYDFPTHDVHVANGNANGQIRSGGAGYTFVVYRFLVSDLGQYCPRGSTIAVVAWAEAQSDLYHHFAFDYIDSKTWTIP